MFEKLKRWFGLNGRSDYVREFFYDANMRAVIYMCIVVILLELWMIWRLTRIVIISWPRTIDWMVSHYKNYVILLTSAVVMIIYAIRYRKGKANNRLVGTILLWAFSFICIYFGIEVGAASYAAGEQILTFLTMTVFVFCILYWTPVQSLVFTSATYLIFYYQINKAVPVSEGTQINLFTMWIATYMIAMSAYHQKVSEAQKAESVTASNRRLAQANDEDDLTDLPNMRWFKRICSALILSSAAEREKHTFLFLDIEQFKAYNEKYNYKQGDALLRKVAVILKETFRDDPVARVSDDHFVAYTAIDTAQERIAEARAKIAALDRQVRIDLKTGSCTPAMGNNDVGLACGRARIACNRLKKQYKTCYLAYDEALEKEISRKQYVINSIDAAVENGWIKVYYQPVVKCADGNGELVGLEALARWDDPGLGLLPPFQFIETLEEYREIHKLDRCIIEQVCQDLREALDQGLAAVPVSLNFSRLDFELYDVPSFLREMTEKYSIPGNMLDVEITESALTDQFSQLQENMRRLREAGFSLWLDDFGSGYSSLNVLKDFSFDVLKIDMIFLRSFSMEGKSVPIITMIITLAKLLGMVTLCEGVETKEQFEFLQKAGCDKAQGYYFSKPLPREELLKKYFS